MSLWYLLLTKPKTLPVRKGEMFIESSYYITKLANKGGFESKGNKLTTGTDAEEE